MTISYITEWEALPNLRSLNAAKYLAQDKLPRREQCRR